jgi:hypothetical protein
MASKQVGCSERIRRRKATAKFMYAALDLHEKSIQCVLKDDTGKVVKESKMGKDEDRILEFLDGTQASVVMESGYNHQHIYDLLKEEGVRRQGGPSPDGQGDRIREGEER